VFNPNPTLFGVELILQRKNIEVLTQLMSLPLHVKCS